MARNGFVSVIDPNVKAKCALCLLREFYLIASVKVQDSNHFLMYYFCLRGMRRILHRKLLSVEQVIIKNRENWQFLNFLIKQAKIF